MALTAKFSSNKSRGILGEPDNEEMWNEILNHIPDKLLVKPGVRILNIACGQGTEAVILAKRMFDLGISKDAVNESIHLVDNSTIYTNYVRRTYGFKNVHCTDFLTWESDVKFDVVVGNPPYKELAGNGRQTNKSIWKDFIVKSTTLLNKNGHMMFVTPTGWCSPSDNGKLIENIFSRLNLIYADISDSVRDHFNGVGSTFGYTITVNEPYTNKTVIKTNDGVHVVDLKKTKLITKVGMSIITKLTTSLHPQCRFKQAGKEYQYSGTGYHTDDKPADAIYKNIHHVNSGKDYLPGTTIPVRWSVDKSSVSDCRKVVIPYNGPVNVIVDSGEYGVGWCQTLLLGDRDLIEAAEQVFGGKLFKFFAKQRSTQYNETKNLNQFPMLDLTHRWTDEEIYEHFNLTEEEIELVKSY